MSANLQLYTLIFAVADGVLLAEEISIDVTRTTNSQPVATVAKGYAGESPGAAMMEVDVTNAIPSGGFEFDMGKKIAGLIPLNVQVLGPGGTSARGQAFVYSDSIRHGVNQEAQYSFRARMPLTLFT